MGAFGLVATTRNIWLVLFVYGCVVWFAAVVVDVRVLAPAKANETAVFVGIPLAVGAVGALIGRMVQRLPALVAGVLVGHAGAYVVGLYPVPTAAELVEVVFAVAVWMSVLAAGYVAVVALARSGLRSETKDRRG